MRILYVQDSLGSGGAERSNAELWYYLKKNHHILKIVVLKHRKHGVEKEILEMGFDVVFLKPGYYLSHVKELARIIKEFKPELVHSVLFNSNIRVRGAKLFATFYHMESLVNCPYTKSRLNDPNVNKIKLTFYRFLDYFTQINGVDHFHANGKTVAEHYKNKLKIKPSRITIVPRGRKENMFLKDKETIQTLRTEMGAGTRVVFINVARHEYQKAQEVLVKAFGKLPPKYKKDWLLLIVGRDGELTQKIKDNIERYKLIDNVKLLGHRSDVYKLLAASDVFVFPSRFEGLPGALIEAEAAGLPIICSNILNNIEVARDNENAFVFPLDDVKSLTISIQKFLLNKQLREEMGEISLKIYKNKFTIEAVHQRMFDMYLEQIRHNTD